MLKVDVRVGETIKFSGTGDVSLTLKAKSGRLSRFEVDADSSIDIKLPHRDSVRNAVSEGLTAKDGKN